MKRLAWGLYVLAAIVALFGTLALDVAWRVWATRASFDGPDVPLLLLVESARGLATFALIGIALRVLRTREPWSVAFATFLLFLGLWFSKATFNGFPGFLQERLAGALLNAGASRSALRLFFASPGWALPPAAAALLAFALRFPERPDPATVRSVHATGRKGTLRNVALAGTDVRSVVHRAAASILENGWASPLSLTAVAVVGGTGMAMGGPVLQAGVLIALAALTGCALAFLRTAWLTTSAGDARRLLARLGTAAVAACGGLLAGGALSFLPGAGMARIALALTAAAPLIAVVQLAGFGRSDPTPA